MKVLKTIPNQPRVLDWVMLVLSVFGYGAGCVALAPGQELPEAPRPHLRLAQPRFAAATIATRVAARSLDVVSTNRVLGMRGGREYELPPWIVNHTASLAGFEAGVVGAEMLGEHELRRRGHRRLARLVPLLDTTAVSVTVAMNYRVSPAAKVSGTVIGRKP